MRPELKPQSHKKKKKKKKKTKPHAWAKNKNPRIKTPVQSKIIKNLKQTNNRRILWALQSKSSGRTLA
jgi:hypothetical protein